jgi:putative DNA-invertase from lambdoid prophage Rac
VVQEFIDRDSGTKSDRPGFKAMMEAAGKHEFDHVVFWSLDRVTRNGALDALQILNKLTHWRVGYRSLQEPYIDSASPFADVLIALLGTVARLERDRLRERIAAGLARAKEKGTASGREIGRPRIVLDRDRLASLRARGLSWSKISKVTGHKITTIRMALKAYRKPCGNLPAKEPS